MRINKVGSRIAGKITEKTNKRFKGAGGGNKVKRRKFRDSEKGEGRSE